MDSHFKIRQFQKATFSKKKRYLALSCKLAQLPSIGAAVSLELLDQAVDLSVALTIVVADLLQCCVNLRLYRQWVYESASFLSVLLRALH